MTDKIFRFKSESFVLREADNEMVLVPLTNDIVDMTNIMILNEVASDIIKLLDGKTSLKKISEILLEKYEIDKEVLENDIIQFIKRVGERRMVEEVVNN